MSQNLTARGSVVAQRILELLTPFIGDDTFCNPTIQGVSYGDQQKLPACPWVCVESGDKTRDWPPTMTDTTEILLQVTIYVYHVNLEEGVEASRLECDQVGEAIEEYLNVNHRQLRDADGNDLVIYGYCIKVEPGYTTRARTTYRGTRITWQARSKLRLTQAQ